MPIEAKVQDADLKRLWEINPTARIQLENIIQARIIAEQEAELDSLRGEKLKGEKPSENGVAPEARAARRRAAKE